MYIDKNLTFCTAQAVTVTAPTADVIDLGSARDLGPSEPRIAIICTEAATAAGAATVQFQLQCDDNSGFSSPKTVIQTDAIVKTDLVVGKTYFLIVPPGLDERYIRLNFVVGTGPLTAGKFTAMVVSAEQYSKAYVANQV